MTKEPDLTQTQDSLNELIVMLKQELVNCQDPKHAPHASKEERAAAKYLYEHALNYQAMIRKRPLTRVVEFITNAQGPGFSASGTGWYYQPAMLRPGQLPHINWVGPFSSHHEAQQKRIAHLPKNRVSLQLERLFED